MPLFEFRCDECQERFEELLRSARDAGEVVCPRCGSTRVERLQSGFATVGSTSTGASSGSSGSSCTGHGGFS